MQKILDWNFISSETSIANSFTKYRNLLTTKAMPIKY